MLNIILGKENKPTGNYVHDANKFFPVVGIPDNEASRVILSNVEKAEYLSTDSFIDRYGYKVYMLGLSTGSKILLEIENSDKVINGVELGQNAFEVMIQSISGNVYFDNVDRFDLPDYFELGNISVNGKVFSTRLDLENALWKE
jgi:hypothetical protein